MKLSDVILEPDTAANQPDATDVPIGTIYCMTDSTPANTLQRSNGTTWDDFAPTTASAPADVTSVIKSADESVTSSTTLQDDDELFWTVGTVQTWIFRLVIVYTADSGARIKVAMTTPSGTILWSSMGKDGSGSSNAGGFATNSSASSGVASGSHGGAGSTLMHFILDGHLVTAGSGGTIHFQFAQNASSGTATIVKAGSTLMAWNVT